MKTEFICSICGKVISNLDDYVNHVKTCADREKAEAEAEKKKQQKYLKEVEAAINKVNTAKSYYEECLKDFESKYPLEYELHFASTTYEHDDTEDISDDDIVDALGLFLGLF